jgi:hypothetical protein
MKWFERLFESDSEKMMREDRERLEKVVEPLPEVVEPKPTPEPEKPKEVVYVTATGSWNVKVHEREERYDFQHPYYIEFGYDVEVNLIGEIIPCKGSFYRSPHDDLDTYDRRRFGWFSNDYEADAYEWLAKILDEGNDDIMKEFRSKIVYDIRKHLKDKNIEKIKESIAKNNTFELNLNFAIEKDLLK